LEHCYYYAAKASTMASKLQCLGNEIKINLMKDQEQMKARDQGVLEGLEDILDMVMEYKPEIVVPNIKDHIFNVEHDKNIRDKDNIAVDNGEMTQSRRPCLSDFVELGWRKLEDMNVAKKMMMVANERTRQKRSTTQYIMDRVAKMKEQTIFTIIPPEIEEVEVLAFANTTS
jgi:hypothetical protein